VEQVQLRSAGLRLLARAARGSMRDALSLTDQAIAFGFGQLQEATVRQMLGSVDRSYVFRLIEALALGDGKTVVETSRHLAPQWPQRGFHTGRNVHGAATHGRGADPGGSQMGVAVDDDGDPEPLRDRPFGRR
jgi:hypothetical protein